MVLLGMVRLALASFRISCVGRLGEKRSCFERVGGAANELHPFGDRQSLFLIRSSGFWVRFVDFGLRLAETLDSLIPWDIGKLS